MSTSARRYSVVDKRAQSLNYDPIESPDTSLLSSCEGWTSCWMLAGQQQVNLFESVGRGGVKEGKAVNHSMR